MQKLKKENYYKVKLLFDNLSFNLAISSMIDGNTQGQIYVDNSEKPETALIWNEMTELFFGGKISETVINKLENLIKKKLIPEAKEGYIPGFNIYYPSVEWKDKIEDIFTDYKIKIIKRNFYEFNDLIYDWEKKKPDNIELLPISCSLLNSNYKNVKQMEGWIRSFWKRCRDFERKGIGYCLIKNELIASWSFSVYISEDKCELAVATVNNEQQKGYGRLTAAATLSQSIDNGLNPEWHCDRDNTPSVLIARDVGFKKVKDYKIIGIEF